MLHYFITFKAVYPSFATDKAVNEMLNFLGWGGEGWYIFSRLGETSSYSSLGGLLVLSDTGEQNRGEGSADLTEAHLDAI